MQIRTERQFGTQVIALLTEHLSSMAALCPPESVHALDLAALQSSEVTFWCAWDDTISDADVDLALMGCGALQEIGPGQGEIKSMRSAAGYQRQGVAASILEQILDTAIQRGYCSVSLETGSAEFFLPARMLYRRYGFIECPPFADYVLDPHSIFMTLDLRNAQA